MAVKRPEWLEEYRKRTKIIEVIDMAFDEEVSDEDVRNRLKEVAEDLQDLFMPPSGKQPTSRRRPRS